MPATRTRSDRLPPAPAASGGGGWFLLLILALGLFACVVFAPDSLRSVATIAAPTELGPEPSRTVAATAATTAARVDRAMPPRAIAIELTEEPTGSPMVIDAPELPGRPVADTPVVADGDSTELLARAETAYRSFDWDQARDLAESALRSSASEADAVRARDILRGADQLEEMFARLDTRDGLVRNLETHPKLVTITVRGRDEDVVPVVDPHDRQVPDTDDPAGWLRSQLKQEGRASVMNTSGITYPVERTEVVDIRPADLAMLRAEKRREFERRQRRLENSDLAEDPLAWYEAAKYAYRNRLDALVTDMLDRALEIDPFLAKTIKEDAAREHFLKMVQQLENDNRAAAAGWKEQLDKYYRDTAVYPEALAYYRGNQKQMRLARAEAERKRHEAKRRTREERLARAKALEDREAIAQLERERRQERERRDEPVEETDTGAPVSPPGGPEMAKADAHFNKGAEIYAQAQSLGVTEKRDRLYAEAQKEFTAAMNIYGRLGMEAEMVKANQYRYACIKYRRFF